MRAVAITPGQKQSAHMREVPKPAPKPGQLLIKMLDVGICATDRDIIEAQFGSAPPGEDFLILGHESFGQVVELGAGLEGSGWKPGDYVVCTVRRPCHAPDDPNCQHGKSDMCLTGTYTETGIKDLHGYMSDYYAESADFAIKVPPEFRRFGVLLEPTAVSEKGIVQSFKIQERLDWEPKRAYVLGAGPIGLLGTFLLRNLGLEVITAATRPPGPGNLKSQLVEACGATYISTRETPVTEFARRFGQADLILEASGVAALVFEAAHQLCINGVLCLLSVSPGHNFVQVDADKFNQEFMLGNKVLFGSVNANRTYFEKAVERWKEIEQKWPGLVQRVITRRVPMEQFASALDRDPDEIKTVITISE